MVETQRRDTGLIGNGMSKGVAVASTDSAPLYLEATLAVAGTLLNDRHHVGAGGPAEVGQPPQDLHNLPSLTRLRFLIYPLPIYSSLIYSPTHSSPTLNGRRTLRIVPVVTTTADAVMLCSLSNDESGLYAVA